VGMVLEVVNVPCKDVDGAHAQTRTLNVDRA
jgi:hypothetical protein